MLADWLEGAACPPPPFPNGTCKRRATFVAVAPLVAYCFLPTCKGVGVGEDACARVCGTGRMGVDHDAQEDVERFAGLGKGERASDYLRAGYRGDLDAKATRAGLQALLHWIGCVFLADEGPFNNCTREMRQARVRVPRSSMPEMRCGTALRCDRAGVRSPGCRTRPLVLSTVTMPPMESVKNSSTLGPIPSSGARTDLERATPAKKKFVSSALGRHAAHAMTGTAVSAATYCRKTAVFFLRDRQIIPGCTVAHS